VLTVAYLANQFPAAVEPYVSEEIGELRRRGVRVIAGSVRRVDSAQDRGDGQSEAEILCLQPVRLAILLRALWLAARRWDRIAGIVKRVLLEGKESPMRRLKALLHTWLGAYYAVLLRERGVDHIHAHHGYFGSWITMVAARLLGVSFSLTLHGSDLLMANVYLDTKLKYCWFCITISEYNRRYILQHFPSVDRGKIMVSRLGVDLPERVEFRPNGDRAHTFTLLAVGRLHAVKDHAFLIRACARLGDRGLDFECRIAGEGPERASLERAIRESRLQDRVKLLGHVAREQIDSLYCRADVVVLTSRSEGIPLVLMEAMTRGKIVLAPAITGIPELVIAGKTGFLYAPGVVKDFVEKILNLKRSLASENHAAENFYVGGRLEWIRQAARVQVLHNFNRQTNLTRFADRFVQRVISNKSADESAGDDFDNQDFPNHDWSPPDENLVLQQI
jgi:colanic acid/amylovoran biosynthesis glycosyltransferase